VYQPILNGEPGEKRNGTPLETSARHAAKRAA
jgi:hypothetical protein